MGFSFDFCVGTVSKVPTKFTGNSSSNIRIFRPHGSSLDLLKNEVLFDLLWKHGITNKSLKDVSSSASEKEYVYIYDDHELTNRSVYNQRMCAQSCSYILEKVNSLLKFVENNIIRRREDTLESLHSMRTMLSSAILRKHNYCLFVPT